MFRAARLRSKVYWTSPERLERLRWLLGMKVLLYREAWGSPSTHTEHVIGISKWAAPGWHPTEHHYGKGPACLRQTACVEICRNGEPLCTAQQMGSTAQSITWFSDSQPSCLVTTLTLINFKVQWRTKFRSPTPCCNFCQNWPSATNLGSCVSVAKSLWSRKCKLRRKRREWLMKEPSYCFVWVWVASTDQSPAWVQTNML